LEQKSGHRILWTENTKENSILIWYVMPHKAVSRAIGLIDDSLRRSYLQRTFVNESNTLSVDGSVCPRHSCVVLDPSGNVPLKIYDICGEDIDSTAWDDDSWIPRLHLTEEERNVVENKGTTLLLGRSGTGKTVCICNRMDFDRQRFGHTTNFTQLFVARSLRLCAYVQEVVGSHPCATYNIFEDLLKDLEVMLPKFGEDHSNVFLRSQKIDLAKFKRFEFAKRENSGLDPLVIWTCIRSFIKGSIEAVMDTRRILSREAFMKLGKKRCRLMPDDRAIVYNVFEKYQTTLKELNVWDDCERIVALIERTDMAIASDKETFATIHVSKVYVDEVQDYTQAEILLFFKLSGPGDLFLGGDPAQSVVEGVEFRFEDIRSVGYHVADQQGCRYLIPEKPKTLSVNFRSHSGILNVAASILQCLFSVFPDSAKQLGEDRGLFAGPRPTVLHKVGASVLQELVNGKLNGAVVLTHDDMVSHWKGLLGQYPLVYGIRAAKGLEFKSVIIVDFFAELPITIQKPWRDLLLGRSGADSFPEIEGQLKLLYTAVTRCIDKLFVAETRRSFAGDAMVRWLTTSSTRLGGVTGGVTLASSGNVHDIESMAMTSDEWMTNGLKNADMADCCDSADDAKAWLEKAIYCFDQTKEASGFCRIAKMQMSSAIFRMLLDK
jgi:hypothetical protein